MVPCCRIICSDVSRFKMPHFSLILFLSLVNCVILYLSYFTLMVPRLLNISERYQKVWYRLWNFVAAKGFKCTLAGAEGVMSCLNGSGSTIGRAKQKQNAQ